MQNIFGKNIWFFNNGQNVPDGDLSRNWEACKIYGFISAGQTKKDYTYARKPRKEDILCVYQSKLGFVGIGTVQKMAIPIRQFLFDDKNSLRNKPGIIMGDRRNHGLFHLEEDPILCEQVLKVDWKVKDKTPLWMSKKEDGHFSRRGTCVSLNSEQSTLLRIQSHFEVTFILNNS